MPRRRPVGAPGDPGRFPAGSVARRVNAETRLILGGQRALLMQLAHPFVAASVADHSDFLGDPFRRLWNTMDLTLTIGFGDRRQADTASARVARTHARVHGSRRDLTYRATDGDLLTWVHATLVDSAIETYETFVGRIGRDARDRYLREMHAQARAFGVSDDHLWPNYEAFRQYVASTTSSLDVTDEARLLGAAVVAPPMPPALRPVVHVLRFVTAGLLPPALRPPFGLSWSPSRDRTLRALATTIRLGGPLLPDGARRWPHAREADMRLRHPVLPTASDERPTPPDAPTRR